MLLVLFYVVYWSTVLLLYVRYHACCHYIDCSLVGLVYCDIVVLYCVMCVIVLFVLFRERFSLCALMFDCVVVACCVCVMYEGCMCMIAVLSYLMYIVVLCYCITVVLCVVVVFCCGNVSACYFISFVCVVVIGVFVLSM